MSLESSRQQGFIVIRDGKFHFFENPQPAETETTIILEPETAPQTWQDEVLAPDVELIIIRQGSFSDGRAFSMGRRIRCLGFGGVLRLKGPLIADQYPMAIRCGFDEIEITASQARRQPQVQWSRALERTGNNYLSILGNREPLRFGEGAVVQP